MSETGQGAAAGRWFDRVLASGQAGQVERLLPVEMPVAVEFNGLGYAVLMATPDDLEDLAHGFALSERLIEARDDICDVAHHVAERGIFLRVYLREELAERVFARVRHRVSESSCGLCGIENLEQALRPLPRVQARSEAGPPEIFRALAALSDHQPLNRATGAVHAAALCSAAGEIRLAREDVGRHNAFDKLIGAMQRQGLSWDGGFALLTSRCSYEIVEKASLADCPLLATISAPTDLAARRAEEAGLSLAVLARPDAVLMRPARMEQKA